MRNHGGRSTPNKDSDLLRIVPAERLDIDSIGLSNGSVLETWHVTDDPRRVLRALARKGSLMVTYPEKGSASELGPGLYVSGRPDYWLSRSTNKWDFLPRLSDKEMSVLLDTLRSDIESRTRGQITVSERDRALRDIGHVRRDAVGRSVLISLADQPYNLPFWKPEFLEKLGFRAGTPPVVLTVRLRGPVAELRRSRPDPLLLHSLREAGVVGAFTRAGMGSNPELVIWDAKAVVGAEVDEP